MLGLTFDPSFHVVQMAQNKVPSASLGPSPKKKRVSETKGSAYNIGVVGSGNIARAIVEGILASGLVNPSNITTSATSTASENLTKMKALGVNTTVVNRQVIRNSDIVIVAVKPYQVLDVMSEFQTLYSEVQTGTGSGAVNAPKNLRPLIVSVAASVTIRDIEQKTEISWNIGGSPIVGHLPVIRCLPTIASCVRTGVTVYSRGKFCNDTDKKPFITLFSLCGYCEEVAEKHLDAFTAFSGSGVAFMAVALEAMADGGVLVGLPRPMAQRVAAYTMLSTAKIILEKQQHPSELKDAVCSPGGTTIHGIQSLERAGFRSAIMEAIKSATERVEQLRPKT